MDENTIPFRTKIHTCSALCDVNPITAQEVTNSCKKMNICTYAPNLENWVLRTLLNQEISDEICNSVDRSSLA